MKETKEMMEILSENKKKVQEKKKSVKEAKTKALDVFGAIMICLIAFITIMLISKIPNKYDVNRDGSVNAKDLLELRQELED